LGCTTQNENDKSGVDSYTSKYVVEITTTNNEKFEIYVPIVYNDENKEISSIMNVLEISGSCNYSIERTIHGNALKIVGNGDVTLKSEGSEKIEFGFLNLINNTDSNGIRIDENGNVEYWLFIDDSNITINSIRVSCYIDHYSDDTSKGSHSFLFFLESNKRGWFTIEGKIGYEHGE